MSDNNDERRHFSRVQFQSECFLTFGDKKYAGKLVDLSLKGALIHNDEVLKVKSGDRCSFNFALDGAGFELNFDATLVYYQNDQLGVQFGNIDLESMTHLRRLVELNTGDSGKVQDELFFLISK
ncbi:MAG: PilZ domain-containing protein [Deltaproteobacteria bacterium]|jgi:hypothetical protein|nr:PilZ domain-containing protein [Deltaproteobacteria bacterium]MBT4527736.1 PilZ domain-containing protein [Deltaproteobacteria bacterium]